MLVRHNRVRHCIYVYTVFHLNAILQSMFADQTTSVRLVTADGASSNEGRLELYYNNTWGTVCDEGWNITDAHVVCRMLGYPFALQYRTSAYYGEGSDPVWMSGLSCTGRENNITDCYHNGFTTSSHCSHSNDVGVVCASKIMHHSFIV